MAKIETKYFFRDVRNFFNQQERFEVEIGPGNKIA